jgi:hypothetical protein
MSWTVISERLDWPVGTVLTDDDLAGCNIDALVTAGHLAPAHKPKAVRENDPVEPGEED